MKKSFYPVIILAAMAAFGTAGNAQAQSPEAQGQAPAAEPDTLDFSRYEMLDEVVVATSRPVLVSDGATTTYNVDEDPAASSSTVLDILKKVPMISVDGEGNIRLKGETNFKLQVNGQENPMLQQYAGRIMEAMPASAIVKIEVITEPGAKEDAEGVAGIINIITERTKSQDGYSGNVTLKADNRSLGPSVYGIVKKDKVTLSANVDYQWSYSPMKTEGETTNEYLSGTELGSLVFKSGQKSKFQYVGGNLNLSWEPNMKNLFTFGVNVFNMNASLRDMISSNIRYAADGSRLWSFDQDGDGGMKMFNLSVNASYRHNFADEGNYLILSYMFNFGRTNLNFNQWQTDAFNYLATAAYNNRDSHSYNRGHTVQADYANNFKSEHHLLEAGFKGIFRYNNAISSYMAGMTPDVLLPVTDPSDDIIQPQDIYAGYASYTGTFDKFVAVAGLRYEHTKMGIRYPMDGRMNFTNHLNDWVPNVSLTYTISPLSNLRASYQMRISRPSIQQVNPFELSISPFDVRKGNPDLTSEKSHKIALAYSAFGNKFGGNIGVEYNLVDNAIQSFSYLRQDGTTGVVVTSFANIGKTHEIALNGFLNWNVIRSMSLTVNGRLGYNILKSPAEGYENKGLTGMIGGAWNYSPGQGYKLSAYGGWMAPRLSVQGHTSGFYYYGLSAGKDFLKDKSLNVSLSATNFAQKSMVFKNYTETRDVINNSLWRNLTAWTVGVSVTWKFGSLQAKVKETGANVNNDDVNKASNQTQGSGTGM